MPSTTEPLPTTKPLLTEEPQWLLDSKLIYEMAFNEKEGVYKSLKTTKKAFDEDYYSNDVLHKTVGKLTECEQMLVKLQEEKNNIKKTLAEQKSLFEKHSLQTFKKQQELEVLNAKLITSLLQWKEKAEKTNQENDKATQEFHAINKRIELNKKKYNELTILNEYALFLKLYSDRVKIAEETTNRYKISGYTQPSLPLCGIIAVTTRQDLLTQEPAKLREIAELTYDAELTKQANFYYSEWSSHFQAQQQFKLKSPGEGWPSLDKQAHKTQLLTAVELIAEYVKAASSLTENCKEFLAKIQAEQQELFQRIDLFGSEDGKLNDARKKFIRSLLTNDKKDPERQLMMVQCFDKLKSVIKEANAASDRFREDNAEIANKYQQMHEMYGAYRPVEIYNYTLNMMSSIQGLEQTIQVAEDYLQAKNPIVESNRNELLRAELKQLLRMAINNTEFWNNQIWYFSSYKIGKIPVPHGVADLYQDLQMADQNKFSVDETIKAFQVTVTHREDAGMGKIFKRSICTTNEFYKLIAELSMKDFDRASFEKFKQKLCNIQDSTGRKLIAKAPAAIVKDKIVAENLSPKAKLVMAK